MVEGAHLEENILGKFLGVSNPSLSAILFYRFFNYLPFGLVRRVIGVCFDGLMIRAKRCSRCSADI